MEDLNSTKIIYLCNNYTLIDHQQFYCFSTLLPALSSAHVYYKIIIRGETTNKHRKQGTTYKI